MVVSWARRVLRTRGSCRLVRAPCIFGTVLQAVEKVLPKPGIIILQFVLASVRVRQVKFLLQWALVLVG